MIRGTDTFPEGHRFSEKELQDYFLPTLLVGSGTFGCCTFGDCLLYQLPNSGIVFSYGFKVFFHDAFEEGKGFLPDYWIDDEDPVSVARQYIAQ